MKLIHDHYTELCSSIQYTHHTHITTSHPLLPVCPALLTLLNSLLQQQCTATRSPSFCKFAFRLLSVFITTITRLQHRCEDGAPSLSLQQIPADAIEEYMKGWNDDCCARCGCRIPITQSLCAACLKLPRTLASQPEEQQKQCLINFLNVACYSQYGSLWKASRSTLLALWTHSPTTHDDKKKKLTREGIATVPPRTSIPSVHSRASSDA